MRKRPPGAFTASSKLRTRRGDPHHWTCAAGGHDRDGDFEAVKADSAPYEDGIVHKKTAIEVDNFRFFKQVYATKKQLDEFEAACDATDAACQLAVPV